MALTATAFAFVSTCFCAAPAVGARAAGKGSPLDDVGPSARSARRVRPGQWRRRRGQGRWLRGRAGRGRGSSLRGFGRRAGGGWGERRGQQFRARIAAAFLAAASAARPARGAPRSPRAARRRRSGFAGSVLQNALISGASELPESGAERPPSRPTSRGRAAQKRRQREGDRRSHRRRACGRIAFPPCSNRPCVRSRGGGAPAFSRAARRPGRGRDSWHAIAITMLHAPRIS